MKIIFKILFLLLVTLSFSNAELLSPNNAISPKEVVKIQLSGLQQNDLNYKDVVIKLRKELKELRIKYKDSEELEKSFIYN